MSLPFTVDQFLGVFASYNNAIWPAQIVLNITGILAVVLCFRTTVPSAFISALLAGLWAWTGIMYHIAFFSAIKSAAFIFGGMCVLQAILFALFGGIRKELSFRYQKNVKGVTGALMMGYGLIVYPILGYFLGHVYPSSPTFGAPCPTTIFTFGLLLWSTRPVRGYLLAIPFLWSLIGAAAAWTLGIREDFGLLVSGILGTILLSVRSGRLKQPAVL